MTRLPDVHENLLTGLRQSLLFLGVEFLEGLHSLPITPIAHVDTNSPKGKPKDLAGRDGRKTHTFALPPTLLSLQELVQNTLG